MKLGLVTPWDPGSKRQDNSSSLDFSMSLAYCFHTLVFAALPRIPGLFMGDLDTKLTSYQKFIKTLLKSIR